ncbi:MAG: hypothetical protein NZ839_05110, partial [Endomicrobia bacterium]|nr:hypothetical protein [Endomicrobiia bacterium]
MKVFVIMIFVFVCVTQSFSTTAKVRNVIIDGTITFPTEWHQDEVYCDSQNDSPWGLYNELHKLFVTWDESALYIAVVGVQKDGNNLIVYIDTSPFSGIDDASKLKDPNNPQKLWWWRRGNVFPENFKPELQWHMYEMQLNINEGHGLFKLNDNYTVVSLNDKVIQKSSGGGTAKLGFAEIKIPWSVLYNFPFFPAGNEINILVCFTGGMDTKGTEDSSDDEFGSARDTIPDQKSNFPEIWYQKFKIDNFLTLKLDRIEGRQPYSRNLLVTKITADSVIVKFDFFPWQSKQTEFDYLVYCSTDFWNIRNSVYKITKQRYTYFEDLSLDTTYYFTVVTSPNDGLSETVMVYIPNFVIKEHKPQKFLFRGKELEINFTYKGYTDKEVELHWKYKDSNTEFTKLNLVKKDENKYVGKLPKVEQSVEFYVTVGTKIKYPPVGVAVVDVVDSEIIVVEPDKEKNVVLYDGANYKLTLQIPKNAVAATKNLVVENLSLQQLFNYSNL